MSGHAHRRHSTRVFLAAALACALAWLGVAGAREIGPVSLGVHAGAEVVITKPSAQHVAQRAAARLGHVRAALVAASQRTSGTTALRLLAIVLATLSGLVLMRRSPSRRRVLPMRGVRAPPAPARDRAAA